MTISTLVPLIGHTSASAALQDCMLGLGMKKMPKGDATTRVRTQDKLVSLEFDPTESYMGRNVREPVGDGGFTLESFDAPGIPGELPFGLSLAMDRQQVDAALGRALDEDPEAEVQTYHRDAFLIIVFYGGKGRKIDTFRFTRPNVHSARKFNIELQAAAAETPGAAAPAVRPGTAVLPGRITGRRRLWRLAGPAWHPRPSACGLALTAMAPRRTRRCARRA